MKNQNGYRVTISFDVETDEDRAVVDEKITALLDHGSVRDSFSEINLRASNFEVLGLKATGTHGRRGRDD